MNVGRLLRAIFPALTAALTAALLLFPAVALAKTYYVDVVNGDDTRSSKTATSPSTPVKSIKVGLSFASPGDTVIVKPGVYREAVESKRDGLFGAPITLKSETPGGATIQPLAATSNGVFISHNYFTIDGFDITGGLKGIKAGNHDGGGPIFGVVVKNNEVYGNTDIGVQYENAQSSVADSNLVHDNGCHGIKYQGNAGVIKNNVVQHNGFGATCGNGHGIWVQDGVDYQILNNTSENNAGQDVKIDGSLLPPPGGFRFTYYVAPPPTGDDRRSKTTAQNASTPLATIKKALSFAVAGDTVMVLDGTYQESVESKVDGGSDSPITIKAKNPWMAIIEPPLGNGFVIGHNYHVVEGFVVRNAPNGIQVGPHEVGDGTVTGVVVSDNEVYGNNLVGIKFSNAINGKAQHNVVYRNGGDGIFYNGSNGTIFNNLVYSNGGGGGNKNGITLDSGSGHQVINNTAFGNTAAGIRIGTDANVPVSATVLNNISALNSTGIREQANMRASSTINYNNVPGPGVPNANGTAYALGRSVVGPNSLNADPGFVNTGALDFRLGRKATGQPNDSACIDAGDQTAAARGLSSWTAFTDKAPDTGIVDLGFHGTPIVPAQGTLVMETANLNFFAGNGNDTFQLVFKLVPGAGSDGINPGEEYAQITLGAMQFTLPVTGFTGGPTVWNYLGTSGITSGTFEKLGDNSVRVDVTATDQSLSASESQISVQAQIGDDFASNSFKVQGTLTLAP